MQVEGTIRCAVLRHAKDKILFTDYLTLGMLDIAILCLGTMVTLMRMLVLLVQVHKRLRHRIIRSAGVIDSLAGCGRIPYSFFVELQRALAGLYAALYLVI